MPKIHHDGKGTIKDHDGKPIKAGESVYAESLWDMMVDLQTSLEIEAGKDETKKKEKKEKKFKDLLGIHADNRDKSKIKSRGSA